MALIRCQLVFDGSTVLLQEGCTALHCAAGGGHVDVVQILLARGCLTDTRDKVRLQPGAVSKATEIR